MSPDAQHLERYFSPSDPGQPPPTDAVRYQEELQDFTSFFERLASLDTMDWFATDEAPLPRATPQAASSPPAGAAAPLAERTPEPPLAPAASGTGSLSSAAIPPAAGEDQAAEEKSAAEDAAPAPHTAAGRTPRMHVYHSGVDALDPALGQPGTVGYDARMIISDARDMRQGGPWRTFFARLQLVLLVAFAATLLFSMGLGMGALVLSLPRQAAFDHSGAPAENEAVTNSQSAAESADPAPAAGKAALAEVKLPSMKVPGAAPADSAASGPTKAAPAPHKAAPTPSPSAMASQAPAGAAAAAPAEAPAATAAGQAAAGTAKAAISTPAPAATTVTEMPTTSALEPAATAGEAPAPAPAEGAFALQVGACSSYACVEQFRNLLLSEVESTVIKVVSAGSGPQTIQRIRVEPLGRDAALRLKDALAAKDPRFAQAYLVSLH